VVEKRIIFQGHSPGIPTIPAWRGVEQPRRIFLLSPANASGVRAKMLFGGVSKSDLALRLRHSGAPLGEVYSFISGLYFRGKLSYAETFRNPPAGVPGIHIITAAAGLMLPDILVTLEDLRRISAAAIDPSNRAYRGPLDRDARHLRTLMESDTEVVLLGSIATSKYAEPLIEVFGDRLVFPEEFVGRGDMSRGGLLLRSCSAARPLNYVAVSSALRRGKRPRRLRPRGKGGIAER
jgi:hypothetical protein